MKKLKLMSLILLIAAVLFSAAVYIDYFVVTSRTTYPKISLKKELSENLLVYNSVFYRVWYCKINKTYTIGNYSDMDAICSNTLKYDSNGDYTNAKDVKIEADNMKLISNFYSYEAIGIMNSEEVEDAIYVAKNAYKVKFKYLLDSTGDKMETHSGYNIIQFPKFELNNKDEYEWVFDNEYYCIDSKNQIASYEDEECGEFVSLGIESRWCKLYKFTNLSDSKEAKRLCEE